MNFKGLTYRQVFDTIIDFTDKDIVKILDDSKTREIVRASWIPSRILYSSLNSHQGESTIATRNDETIITVAKSIFKYFSDKDIKLNILEIMAGNCYASYIISCILKNIIDNMICTDIIDYSATRNKEINFERLDPIDAVDSYYDTSNVLLMISPYPAHFIQLCLELRDIYEYLGSKKIPDNYQELRKILKIPFQEDSDYTYKVETINDELIKTISPHIFAKGNIGSYDETFDKKFSALGYGDYYACKDFIDRIRPEEIKYIIIFGRIARYDESESSEGLHDFLENHPNLELVHLELIPDTDNKSVYIYKIENKLICNIIFEEWKENKNRSDVAIKKLIIELSRKYNVRREFILECLKRKGVSIDITLLQKPIIFDYPVVDIKTPEFNSYTNSYNKTIYPIIYSDKQDNL
jgi:hypothetical protein